MGVLTQARLKEVLYYHPESGDFVWLKHPCQSWRNGTQAGFRHNKGYWVIAIDNDRYLAHRLAVLYVTGEWPVAKVDHKDTIKSHNWWTNLRSADDSQNGHNRGVRADNALKLKCICWNARSQKYIVQVQSSGRRVARRASTLEEAIAIRDGLLPELHGAFSRAA